MSTLPARSVGSDQSSRDRFIVSSLVIDSLPLLPKHSPVDSCTPAPQEAQAESTGERQQLTHRCEDATILESEDCGKETYRTTAILKVKNSPVPTGKGFAVPSAAPMRPNKLTTPNTLLSAFIYKECHVRYQMKAGDTLVINIIVKCMY
ncbi:hypothetical protein UY3_16664 [Chelonia mydas]|uniref:Uncharacterized protein n=1 Tax=Chelonia mydas TaxID=8469 RepID=M7AM03_CHEMY|nr:hypothetical protein UY3_16664 [Chelonia mydas]